MVIQKEYKNYVLYLGGRIRMVLKGSFCIFHEVEITERKAWTYTLTIFLS